MHGLGVVPRNSADTERRGATDGFTRPNEQGRRAAQSPAQPLLIIAGAGTGKTNTLAYRVAHL